MNLLSIIEKQMVEKVSLKKRIYSTMVEMFQNIIQHGDDYRKTNDGKAGLFFITVSTALLTWSGDRAKFAVIGTPLSGCTVRVASFELRAACYVFRFTQCGLRVSGYALWVSSLRVRRFTFFVDSRRPCAPYPSPPRTPHPVPRNPYPVTGHISYK